MVAAVGLLRRLRESLPTLRGIKLTSDDLFTMGRVIGLGGGRLNVLSGRDEVAVGALAMGADGLIGSTYNLLPGAFVALYEAMARGDVAEARRLQHAANRVLEVLVRGPAGARTKAAMTLVGIDAGAPRLPGLPLTAAERAALERDLLAAGFAELAALNRK